MFSSGGPGDFMNIALGGKDDSFSPEGAQEGWGYQRLLGEMPPWCHRGWSVPSILEHGAGGTYSETPGCSQMNIYVSGREFRVDTGELLAGSEQWRCEPELR